MDSLESMMLRRRLDLVESILLQSGLVDSVLGTAHTCRPSPSTRPVRSSG